MSNHIYSKEQVRQASLEYFCGNSLAANIFVKKYALQTYDEKFYELNPHQMHDRLAAEFARIERDKYDQSYEHWFNRFREALDSFARIVPQGSPMAALGNPYQLLSTSNCVVIPSPSDDMAGIFETGKQIALLQKRRCGVGVNISSLRWCGAPVNNAARSSTGAYSFSGLYSDITRMVAQNGRRGALMIIIDVHHPDVELFATMKNDLEKVTGANISIFMTDEFMSAVKENKQYKQRWPVDSDNPSFTKMVSAKKVYQTIVESARKTGEPGCIFIDRIRRYLPCDQYERFKTLASNPCSELPLSSWDSCRLISLNLTGYVNQPFVNDFNLDLFVDDVCLAVRMADDLVDIEIEQIDKIVERCDALEERNMWLKFKKSAIHGRRIGLGCHGLGDMLILLGLQYDSEQAMLKIQSIYEIFRNAAYSESCKLARERGPFLDFDPSKDKKSLFVQELPPDIVLDIEKYGRRNISLLTQAPTGTVSNVSKCGPYDLYGTSSGIEPIFRTHYGRRFKVNRDNEDADIKFVDKTGDSWEEYDFIHPLCRAYCEKYNCSLDSLPEELFITSDKIDWHRRIKLQGVIQKFIDHSIASTINLPEGTSVEVVKKLYLEAWENGLNGLTVYVDKSRDGVLISKDESPSQKQRLDKPVKIREKEDACRLSLRTPFGNLHGFLTLRDHKPIEIFASIGKAGDVVNSDLEAMCRLGSLLLRYGVDVNEIIEQLEGIGGNISLPTKNGKVLSLPDALAKAIRIYTGGKPIQKNPIVTYGSIRCPGKLESGLNCSGELEFSEGCCVCRVCGYSKC